jgi:hypothetical protein
MKSLGAFMRAVSKPLAAPLMTSVAADKLKMAKVEEYYEKFIAEYPNDNALNGQNLADMAKTDTIRPISAKPAPKSASATPKKPFVNRGNTQPQLSVATKSVPISPATNKPATPNVVRSANPPKRPVSVNRATPTRPISSNRPIVNKAPVRNVTPNVVKMPISNPAPNRGIATPTRTSAPIKPNVVTTTRPGSTTTNGTTHANDTNTYKLVRPDTANTTLNSENGKNRRQTMLRPPSSVIRPTRSIDNLANQ